MFRTSSPVRRWLTVTAICGDQQTLEDLGRYLHTRVWLHRAMSVEAGVPLALRSDAVILYPESFDVDSLQHALRKLLCCRSVFCIIIAGNGPSVQALSSSAPDGRLVLLSSPVLPPTLLSVLDASIPAPKASRATSN